MDECLCKFMFYWWTGSFTGGGIMLQLHPIREDKSFDQAPRHSHTYQHTNTHTNPNADLAASTKLITRRV